MNRIKTIYGTGIICGILIPNLLKLCGIKIGQEGVDYYAEVHTTKLNSYIHTFFMPFTIYGMFLWIPQFLNLGFYNSIRFNICLYISYMTHYMIINPLIGVILCIFYFIPLLLSYVTYMRINIHKLLYIGLSVSTIALVIQEVFGHWYAGDPPSRFEAIFNAILYAPYYSISHINNNQILFL